MKKALGALPVAAALLYQVPALGQSNVQVYGILDAGIEYVDHAGESGKGMARVISSGKNTSRWGLRGSEDLGGGWKALFNLEGEVEMDTGGTDGPLFKRQANVGLAGRFGQVVVGRSFTTTYDFVSKFDPMGYAPNYSWAVSGNASGPSKYGMTTGFDNLVKYTGQSGGWTYGATAGLGEQAGASQDGRKYAVGTSWNGNGLGIMATYERINGVTVPASAARNRTQAWHMGLSYGIGQWKYAAAMRGYRFDAAAGAAGDLAANTWWLGATRQAGATTLTGAVYRIDTRNARAADADPTMVVVRAMQSLSKQTTLYVALAHAKAARGLPVSLSRDDAGVRDTQTGLTAGMQYRF